MMDLETTFAALNQLKVETGSLACLGCGHEESCSVRGCAILRAAETHLHTLQAERDAAVEQLRKLASCGVCSYGKCFIRGGTEECHFRWKGLDHGKEA